MYRLIICVSLVVVSLLSISSCSDDDRVSVDPQLLTGTSQKTWKLTTQKTMGAADCLGTCELAYNKIRFKTDNTGEYSTFTCMMTPCSNGTSTQDGDIFSWTLRGNQLTIDGFNFAIVSISENTLLLRARILGFDIEQTYVKTPDEEFLNRTRMMAGTDKKIWKYSRREVNGLQTTLTPCLLATRFTNFADGKLTTTYLQEGCGSDTEGTWEFAAAETKYISRRNDGFTIEFDLLELTPVSLVLGFTNSSNQYVVLYQVPE